MCDRLATWAEKWQLRIAFDKCSVHRISNRDSVNVTVCSPKYTSSSAIAERPRDARVTSIRKKLQSRIFETPFGGGGLGET